MLSFIVAMTFLLGSRETFAQSSSTEYQVKAACLLNFVHYIQWPASGLPTSESTFTVGILGDDPFGNILEQMFAGDIKKNSFIVGIGRS